jgi:hypothetical protein
VKKGENTPNYQEGKEIFDKRCSVLRDTTSRIHEAQCSFSTKRGFAAKMGCTLKPGFGVAAESVAILLDKEQLCLGLENGHYVVAVRCVQRLLFLHKPVIDAGLGLLQPSVLAAKAILTAMPFRHPNSALLDLLILQNRASPQSRQPSRFFVTCIYSIIRCICLVSGNKRWARMTSTTGKWDGIESLYSLLEKPRSTKNKPPSPVGTRPIFWDEQVFSRVGAKEPSLDARIVVQSGLCPPSTHEVYTPSKDVVSSFGCVQPLSVEPLAHNAKFEIHKLW